MSPHGFRSTFRTWAQARGENWEAAEISLGHRVGGSVVASYARSDMLEIRRALMGFVRAVRRFRTTQSPREWWPNWPSNETASRVPWRLST